MSKITISHGSLSESILLRDQQSRKRSDSEEPNTSSKKKFKNSTDVTTYWKNIYKKSENTDVKIFECKSKSEYLIITDPLGDRSRFIISKSSYYWLNESIRLLQQNIEYGTTFNNATLAEIIEIERNLKALKLNVEKNGPKKTFFYRAEALLNFIRLCCTFFENPSEKYHQRLHALFNVCANSWLHMLDLMLPKSIVHVGKSFVFDDDHDDFENDSLLRHYLKDDQQKIKNASRDLPNLRHIIYTIVLIIEKLDKAKLIDPIYLERFRMIYEIWMLIDNDINSRDSGNKKNSSKKVSNRKMNQSQIKILSWNFISECQKYEKLFGVFTTNTK